MLFPRTEQNILFYACFDFAEKLIAEKNDDKKLKPFLQHLPLFQYVQKK